MTRRVAGQWYFGIIWGWFYHGLPHQTLALVNQFRKSPWVVCRKSPERIRRGNYMELPMFSELLYKYYFYHYYHSFSQTTSLLFACFLNYDHSSRTTGDSASLGGLGRVNVLSSTRRRRPEPSNRPILKRTPLDDGKGAVWGRFLDP